MTSAYTFANSDSQRMLETVDETEILQHLQELAQKYEEIMQLSDFADFIDLPQDNYPEYTWDNPIGLVVTENPNASLV